MNENPSPKLCECGCGQPAPVAERTYSTHRGQYRYVRGEPVRFIRGHVSRKNTPAEAPRECACGCGNLTTVRGGKAKRFVHGHNAQRRTLGPEDYTVEERGHDTPCWIWANRAHNPGGYGRVEVAGRKALAHRIMYEQTIGPIPIGLELDHLCRVPACIRPDHLEPVTHRENVLRGQRHASWAKGRMSGE